jgi:uncharacterized radical SAM superfamily Fe-S cluster-containing enzyme
MKQLNADTFLSTVSLQARHTRHPDGVTFELTYGCNLRCVHCFNPTHRALPRELVTSEVLRLLDELAAFGVLTVTFTGGEPVVRPDIHTILLHACSRMPHESTPPWFLSCKNAALNKFVSPSTAPRQRHTSE